MRITEVSITDILGTEHAAFKPGSLTVITGSNGSGKSSILSALLAVFEGGSDPSWLRRGAKKGTITLTLDDGVTIQKTVTAKGSTLDIRDSAGHIIPSPQSYINGLADALKVDPGRLLLAKPKDLLAVLLQVMPIAFSADEIREQIPAPARQYATIPPSADLDGLAAVRKQLYESRTGVNKAARDAEGTVATLRRSLPEQDEKDWTAEARELQRQFNATEAAKADADTDLKISRGKEEQATVELFALRIQKLNEERAEAIQAIREALKKDLEQVEAEARPMLTDLTARVAQAQERASAQQKAAGIRESIEKFSLKVRESNALADKLTDGIEALDKLRAAKIASLPIAGLEVQDGKVLVDGVDWPRVNTARRVEVAFQIWDLWNSPFAILDDAEHFDLDTWQAFKDYCLSLNRQVVAARVADGPLRIETEAAQEPVTA